MTTETLILLLLFVLSLVYYFLPSFWIAKVNDLTELAGARDHVTAVENIVGQRAARASANFKETLPWAIALLILVQVTGDANGTTALGGWLYLICRVLYIPAYLSGVAYARSVIWGLSMTGLIMIAWQLL